MDSLDIEQLSPSALEVQSLIKSERSPTLWNKSTKIFYIIIWIIMIIGFLLLIHYMIIKSIGRYPISPTSTFTEIPKPITDYRQYKGIILENQMKVLLVSDPRTEIAGASLEILAGSWNEPNEINGLAHFLEHMLFMGSKKYPNVNDFTDYLSINAGSFNAYTAYQRTNYHFELNNQGLEQALDIFSRFFIDPLFDDTVIEKEINAVNSEYEKNFQLDEWRLQYLVQLILNPDNPASKFTVGNTQTLQINPIKMGINLHDALIKFFNTYYSSNLMSLTLIGNFSLDHLENLAIQKFSEVKNLNTNLPDFSDIPLITSKQAPSITQYLPISQNTSLYLIFPVPSTKEFYLQKPLKYLANLIGNSDDGTLPDLLKQKGYISCFTFEDNYLDSTSGALGLIYMSLTESGMDNLLEIIELVFEQIDLIKKNGVSYKRYQEYQQISKINFDYSLWDSPIMNMASNFSSNLNKYSMNNVLTGDRIFYEYDVEAINLYLNNLTFDQTLIIIGSPKFHFDENSTDSIVYDIPNHKIYYGDLNIYNKLFNVMYSQYSVSQQLRDYINQINYSSSSGFKLPPFNQFIPENLTLIQLCSNVQCNEDFINDKDLLPILIESNELRQTFYHVDRSFLTPTIAMNLKMLSPIIYQDLQNFVSSLIYCTAISIGLDPSFYDLSSVGYIFKYECFINRMDLTIQGYSDKFLEASSIIASGIKNMNITQELFEMSKQKVLNDNADKKTTMLAKYAVDLIQRSLLKTSFMLDEILQGLNNMTYLNFLENTNDLLKDLFMEGIIIGNLDRLTAINILTNITNSINYNPANKSDLLIYEYLNLTNLSLVYKEFSNHEGSSENCLVNYYQDTFFNVENITLLHLLTTYMHPEAFKYLRSEKQLGYIVVVQPLVINRMNAMIIAIQGPVLDPNGLDLEVEVFLEKFENKLRKMTNDDFETLKYGVEADFNQDPKNMDEKLMEYALRIGDGTYDFDVNKEMLSTLATLSKEDLLQFYLNLFKLNQKKLSIQLYANTNTTNQTLPSNILAKNQIYSGVEPILIKDLKELKLFPFIIPENYFSVYNI